MAVRFNTLGGGMSADAQMATQAWSMGREQRLIDMRNRLQKVRDAERARMGRDALVQAASQLDPTSPTFMQDRQRVLANNLESATLDPVGQAAAQLGVDAYRETKGDNVRAENRRWQHEDRDESRQFARSEELRRDAEGREDRKLENPMLWEASEAILLERPELIDDPDLLEDLARRRVQNEQLAAQLSSFGLSETELKSLRDERGFIRPTAAHHFLAREKYFKSVGDRARSAYDLWREDRKIWLDRKKDIDKIEDEAERIRMEADWRMDEPLQPAMPKNIPSKFLPARTATRRDMVAAEGRDKSL